MKKSMISVSKRLFVALLTVVLVLGAVSTQTFAETSSGAEQQVQCTCTKLCTADDYDANCPVCADNWQNCAFKAEEPQSDTSDEPAPADQIDVEKSSEADQSAVPAATALTGYQLDPKDNFIKLDPNNTGVKTESDFVIGKPAARQFTVDVRYDVNKITIADRPGTACVISYPAGFKPLSIPTIDKVSIRHDTKQRTIVIQFQDTSMTAIDFGLTFEQTPSDIIKNLPNTGDNLNFDLQVYTDYGKATQEECTDLNGNTPVSRMTFQVNSKTPAWTEVDTSNSTTWHPVDIATKMTTYNVGRSDVLNVTKTATEDALSAVGSYWNTSRNLVAGEKAFYVSFHKTEGFVSNDVTLKLDIPAVGTLFESKGYSIVAEFKPDNLKETVTFTNQASKWDKPLTFDPFITADFAKKSTWDEMTIGETTYTMTEILSMPGTLTYYFGPNAYVNRFYPYDAQNKWQDANTNSSTWTASQKSYIEFTGNDGVYQKIETKAPLKFTLQQGTNAVNIASEDLVSGLTVAKQYSFTNKEYCDYKGHNAILRFDETSFQFMDNFTLDLDFEEALSPVELTKLFTGTDAGFLYRVYVTDAKTKQVVRIDTILDDITLAKGDYQPKSIGGITETVINTTSQTSYTFADADQPGNTNYISRVEAYKDEYEFNSRLQCTSYQFANTSWVEFTLRAYHHRLSDGTDIPHDYGAVVTRTLSSDQIATPLTATKTIKTKHDVDSVYILHCNDGNQGVVVNTHEVGGQLACFQIKKTADCMLYNVDANGDTIQFGDPNYNPVTVEINNTAVQLTDRLSAEGMRLLGIWDENNQYHDLTTGSVDPEKYIIDTYGCYNAEGKETITDYTSNARSYNQSKRRMYKVDEICAALNAKYATKLVIGIESINDWPASSSDTGIWVALYAKYIKPGHMNYDGLIGQNSGQGFKNVSITVGGTIYCQYNEYLNAVYGRPVSDPNGGNHPGRIGWYNQRYVTFGTYPDGLCVDKLDYFVAPYSNYQDPRGWAWDVSTLMDKEDITNNVFTQISPNLEMTLAAFSVAQTGGGYQMQYQNAEINFTGTDSRLLALTNAIRFDKPASSTVWDFELEYTLSDNPTKVITKKDSARFGRNNQARYLYYEIPGVDIENGIYLTSLKIKLPNNKKWNATNLTASNGTTENDCFPDVGLACYHVTIPEYYPGTTDKVGTVDKSNPDFDQLDFKATIKSDNIFGEKQFEYEATTGKSAKIAVQKAEVSKLAMYDSNSISPATGYQTDTFRVATNPAFDWNVSDPSGQLIIGRGVHLRPTFYYVIDPNFSYVEGSMENKYVTTQFIPAGTGTGTTGSADYGILKVSYDDVAYADLPEAYVVKNTSIVRVNFRGITFRLQAEYDAALGVQSPVKGFWADFNVDANRDGKHGNEQGIIVETANGNGQLLEGAPYGDVFGNTTTAKVNASGKAEMLYYDTSNMKVTIQKKAVQGVSCYAIANAPYAQSTSGVTSKDIVAVDNLFSENVWLTGDSRIQTDSWEVYIPIMKKGQNQSYLDAKSQPAEITPTFSVDLMGVDLTALKSRSQSYQLYYTTDASPAANGYSGLQNLNWTVYDESNPPADMSAVTMLKLTTALAVEEKVPFTLKYKLSEHKSEVGDQVSLNAFYGNFYANGVPQYPNGMPCVPISYKLTDMAVTGQVWEETDYNSTLDTNDTLYQNAEVKLLDAQGNTVSKATSDKKGTYSLAMPHDGAWTVEFVTPDGMKLVKAKENGNPAIDSAFNRTTAKTDINFTADYAKNAYTQANVNAGIYDKPVITVTPGSTSIHVTDTKAGTVAATVTNRVPSTQVSYALKKGEAADIAKVNDLGNESADFDGLKTGTVKCVASIDDGYGSTETTEFDVNVYANVKYDANTGSGTYTDSNNYLPTDDVTVYDGSAFSKTGYTIKEFNEKADGTGTAHAFNSTFKTGAVTSDVTLYAVWEANTYTVTLNTNGGTIASGKDVTSYTYGVGATLPTAADVTKTGYTFDGWYDNAALSGNPVTSISTTAIGNKEYWAKWTANTYTVKLNTNGGTIASGKDVTSYTYGKGATLPTAADVTMTGYTFEGWYDNAGLSGNPVTSISTTAIGNKEYWAKWTANTYTVKLNANGGTIAAGKDVTSYTYGVGAALPTAADVTKTGYTFDGWYDNAGLTGSAVTNITTTDIGNKEYWAKWTANTYKVTLDANGGTIAAGKDVTSYTYGVGAALPTAADVTKTGYTFDGWYDNAQFSGSAVTDITATDLGDKTYYAKWTANTYKVTLNTNGGTIAAGKDVTSYTYGVGAVLPTAADVTKTGYTFDGWYDNAALTGNAVTNITATDIGNKTYWAMWTANPAPYIPVPADDGGNTPATTPRTTNTTVKTQKTTEIDDIEAPAAQTKVEPGHLCMLDLLFILFNVIMTIIMLVLWRKRTQVVDDTVERLARRKYTFIAAVVVLVASIIAFFLTEDLNGVVTFAATCPYLWIYIGFAAITLILFIVNVTAKFKKTE